MCNAINANDGAPISETPENFVLTEEQWGPIFDLVIDAEQGENIGIIPKMVRMAMSTDSSSSARFW